MIDGRLIYLFQCSCCSSNPSDSSTIEKSYFDAGPPIHPMPITVNVNTPTPRWKNRDDRQRSKVTCAIVFATTCATPLNEHKACDYLINWLI